MAALTRRASWAEVRVRAAAALAVLAAPCCFGPCLAAPLPGARCLKHAASLSCIPGCCWHCCCCWSCCCSTGSFGGVSTALTCWRAVALKAAAAPGLWLLGQSMAAPVRVTGGTPYAPGGGVLLTQRIADVLLLLLLLVVGWCACGLFLLCRCCGQYPPGPGPVYVNLVGSRELLLTMGPNPLRPMEPCCQACLSSLQYRPGPGLLLTSDAALANRLLLTLKGLRHCMSVSLSGEVTGITIVFHEPNTPFCMFLSYVAKARCTAELCCTATMNSVRCPAAFTAVL